LSFIPSEKECALYIKGEISRRDFIKKGAAVSAGLFLSPLIDKDMLFASTSFQKKGYVLQVKHEASVKRFRPKAYVVKQMMTEGMKKLTGKSSAADAWKTFFSPDDVVAIKINPIDWMHRMVTNKTMVFEVIRRLKEIGIPENNIIIWDRFEPHVKDAGYRINHSQNGVRFMGTEFRSGSKKFILDYGTYFYANPSSSVLGKKSYYSSIVTKTATKIINMPLLKDHADAGITFALKNMAFGVVNNTRRFHASSCNPMIAEVCSHPVVKNKLVLNIGDALSAIYEGGPFLKNYRNKWMEKSIIFSTDMVAMDRVGLEIIEKKRKEKGLPSLWTKYYKPLHIKTSGLKGLGEHRLSKINHDILKLG
jgi:uncharacterized protein (DUF362 family)